MTYWNNNGMGGGGWVVMALGMVIFWSLLVFVVAAIFRGTRVDPPAPNPGRSDPVEILDQRFARGEIDSDEYQSRKDCLHNTR